MDFQRLPKSACGLTSRWTDPFSSRWIIPARCQPDASLASSQNTLASFLSRTRGTVKRPTCRRSRLQRHAHTPPVRTRPGAGPPRTPHTVRADKLPGCAAGWTHRKLLDSHRRGTAPRTFPSFLLLPLVSLLWRTGALRILVPDLGRATDKIRALLPALSLMSGLNELFPPPETANYFTNSGG